VKIHWVEIDGFVKEKSKLYCKKIHRTTLSPGSRSRAWGGRSQSWLDQRQPKLPDCALDQDSSACMHANTGRKFMDPVAWSKVSLRICPMRSSTHLNSILIYIFLFFGHANRSNLLALSSLMIFSRIQAGDHGPWFWINQSSSPAPGSVVSRE
jgi:hypothetical protein